MLRKLLTLICFVSMASYGLGQVNITFELNSATIKNIDPAGLYIAGGSGFGVPGDNKLSDDDNDGIYTITIEKPEGFSSHYTFLNGNCGDWSCKENLQALPCGDPANYNDRFLPRVTQDTTIKACFGTCDSDGSCTLITDSVEITFELNTATIENIDPSGIFLAGGGNFGVPGDNPMIDPDEDGIYTITITKAKGITSNFTFLNGNCGDWGCKEDLAGLPCADADNYNDRKFNNITQDTTIKACFGNCVTDGTCEATSIIENRELGYTIAPLSNSTWNVALSKDFGNQAQVLIMNTAGAVVTQDQIVGNRYQFNTENYPKGIYIINVNSSNGYFSHKILVD
ncbi:MAG: T9SS type A sorting domain-containing protein [Bacteroidia bacterium]